MIKNILIIGSKALGSIENSYYRAFNELEISGIEFFNTDSYKYRIKKRNLINRAISLGVNPISNFKTSFGLIERLKQKKFDLIIVFKGMELNPTTLKKAKEISDNAIWANINPDDPFNIASRSSTNNNVLNSLHIYDYYFIWSRIIQKTLVKRGLKNALYLPFGYDSHYHYPPNKPLKIIDNQVIFIGAWDTEREEILNKISNYNLVVFGSGWDRISRNSLKGKRIYPYNIYLEELSNAVYSSAVSLNIMRSQNRGAHNMRTFEIPAIGGLMLTNRTEEQNFFFEENKGCFMYENHFELIDKIDYVLNNPENCISIRKYGGILSKPHSYKERANYILNCITK